MRELASRILLDGSGTTVTLFSDGDRLVVEALNCNGTSEAEVSAAEAWDWYMHPFCNEGRLDYPGYTAKPKDSEVVHTANLILAQAIETREEEAA